MSLLISLSGNQAEFLIDQLEQTQTPESAINGFWNAILAQYFPPPYIIKPEEPIGAAGLVNLAATGRPDLVVSRTVFPPNGGVEWHYRIMFEGKKNLGNTQAVWQSVKDEVEKYASAVCVNNGQAVYCVGAVGRWVIFWDYRRGNGAGLRALQRLDNNNPHHLQQNHLPPSYDLINDRAKIVAILMHMRDTLPGQF